MIKRRVKKNEHFHFDTNELGLIFTKQLSLIEGDKGGV